MTQRERMQLVVSHRKPDRTPAVLAGRPEVHRDLVEHFGVEGMGDVHRILGTDGWGGIGIGIPGPINPETGIVTRCVNLGTSWDDYPLAVTLQKLVGLPVTIDNDEWKYNKSYLDALSEGDKKKAAEVGAAYLDHMMEMTDHFVAIAKEKTGGQIKHILLLHMNQLNADYLDALLARYLKRGWKFITVAEAMKDPVYKKKDEYVGPNGISFLKRIK